MVWGNPGPSGQTIPQKLNLAHKNFLLRCINQETPEGAEAAKAIQRSNSAAFWIGLVGDKIGIYGMEGDPDIYITQLKKGVPYSKQFAQGNTGGVAEIPQNVLNTGLVNLGP